MAFDGFDTLAGMLAEAVLNGLWQGLAVTALVWAVLRLAPRTSAATRYGIWSATLAVVLALPFARLATAPLDGAFASTERVLRPLPIHLAASWPPALLAGWAVGAALMLGGLAGGYRYGRRPALRGARPAGGGQGRVGAPGGT